jgi:hypothetical protein
LGRETPSDTNETKEHERKAECDGQQHYHSQPHMIKFIGVGVKLETKIKNSSKN